MHFIADDMIFERKAQPLHFIKKRRFLDSKVSIILNWDLELMIIKGRFQMSIKK